MWIVWVVGSTLALILMNASVGQGQQGEDPQRAYERNLEREQQWQQSLHEHEARQERQEQERWRWHEEQREEGLHDDAQHGGDDD